MKVFRTAAFTSDLANDSIEDEAGRKVLKFGGETISRAIGQHLRDAGFVVTPAARMAERGWDIWVRVEGQALGIRVSDLGKFFVLSAGDDPFLFSLRRRTQKFHADVLQSLNAALNRDGRFHDLLWFGEFGEPYGFTDPVIDAPGSEKRAAPKAWI